MAFRDEQVALIERVARLEDELREARGEKADHARVIEELRELTDRIERAKTRGDADRTELDDLSAAVARIRERLGEPEAPAPARVEQEPKGDARLVLACIAAAVVIVSVIVFASNRETTPKVTKPNDPTSVVEARAEAAKAGLPASGKLLKMKAWYVSPDGQLHTNPTYSPYVEYVFAAPPELTPTTSAARPIGAPADPSTMLQNEYTVTLSPSETRVEQSLNLRMNPPVPDPHCRLADVWKAAQKAGAPAEAVAIIEYVEGIVQSHAMRGALARVPRWHFNIASTPPFDVDISDQDCTVIR